MIMSSAYRILKLNTGDEIITRVQKRQNGKVYMETPMCFRTMLMTDPMTGAQKEITILKDYVSYSTDKFIKIPDSIVISWTSPMEEAVSLYEREKEKKLKSKKREIKNLDTFQNEMKDDMKKWLDTMLSQIDDIQGETPDDIINQMYGRPPGMDEGSFEIDIEFTFSEEITDESTEKDMNHPDYGNRWTDWSSDPNEY